MTCDVCGYALDAGECRNPVCGGGDEARARFAAAKAQREADAAEKAKFDRARAASFQRRKP